MVNFQVDTHMGFGQSHNAVGTLHHFRMNSVTVVLHLSLGGSSVLAVLGPTGPRQVWVMVFPFMLFPRFRTEKVLPALWTPRSHG